MIRQSKVVGSSNLTGKLNFLRIFGKRLTKNRSLLFVYCNAGNPLRGSLNRVLIGVGRISNIGRQAFFGRKPPKYTADYPIWSRCVTHDFENQGVRLPYHEYLQSGFDPSNIICRIPEGTMLDFSYVGEHVSDDTALGALERLLQSVQTVKEENKIPGKWSDAIKWLNDVLSEVWQGRGLVPGAGSLLQFLGVSDGTAFQRQLLFPLSQAGEDPWQYLISILEGRRKCEAQIYVKSMDDAAARWLSYSKARRNLLALLVRFELTPRQFRRIAVPDERNNSGILASDDEIIENPYLISELDQGDGDQDIVTVDVIDRGMRPEPAAAISASDMNPIAHDDPRRVRSCAVAVLKDAARRWRYFVTICRDDRPHKKLLPGKACLPSGPGTHDRSAGFLPRNPRLCSRSRSSHNGPEDSVGART